MNTLWSMWNGETFKIPNTGFTLKGFSIAALRSNFFIPELKIMLDAGLSANVSPELICVTHCHSDHCANLPYHIYSIAEGKRVPILTPAASYSRILGYIKAAFAMSLDNDNEEDIAKHLSSFVDVVPTHPGRIELDHIPGRSITVEIIPCFHTVPSIGFGFIEKRKKLLEEYSHLPGKELAALKKQGININHEVEVPFFIYLGDTSKKILETERIYSYSTIMIECTFILEEELQQAEITQHMHWNDLVKAIRSHPDNFFILYHFSQRYKPEEIRQFFAVNASDITNMHTWISS